MAKNNGTPDLIQAIWNMVGGEEVIRAIVSGEAKLIVRWLKIIDFVGKSTTSSKAEKFFVKYWFRLISEGGICCTYHDKDFKAWFLEDDGKIEDPTTEQVTRYGNLVVSSDNIRIIEEFGGKSKSETKLTVIYDLMWKQLGGENEGDLLTDGNLNIFYARDVKRRLRCVSLRWYRGWYIYACSIKDISKMPVGSRIFAPDL